MFLRAKKRFKDGKEHRYWSVVESQRTADGRVVQRQVLYLGEINDTQKAGWCQAIEAYAEGKDKPEQIALFADDREVPELGCETVQIRLDQMQLCRPRQWGACWLSCVLWEQLQLDEFWGARLKTSRKGTRWLNVLKTLTSYRLIDPGSEWRLHRQWYHDSAMGDLLGEDQRLVQVDKLYRCMDQLLAYKEEMFTHLKARWSSLFEAHFDVLLYDLTSTYFEASPPASGKRQYGYSRDKRPDCVQVVIALVVTPGGLPLAYEVMPGNTADNTTLPEFLRQIEKQYGKADRVWVMDRGIPTDKILADMRQAEPPVHYLVGTPKGRLSKLEQEFIGRPWQQVREAVDVKLLDQDDELYVLARSQQRIHKERGMRQRRLRKLLKRLKQLQAQHLNRDQLMMKLGAAKKDAGRAYGLVKISLSKADKATAPTTFEFTLNKKKLRQVRRREGRYLLRSNLSGSDPAQLWQYYMRLTEIEQAFKELKSDLSIRPIYHQRDDRIESHIFIAFIAYCLQATLKHRLKPLAPGLTPRAAIDTLKSMQMIDVHLPTTDGRYLVLPRFTQPDQQQRLLLQQLRLELPRQPPPRIRTTHPEIEKQAV